MIRISRSITIPEEELDERFTRSSGPGGQNVNKVATAVQLRFDVDGSQALPDDVKVRLKDQAGSRLTDEGQVLIEASRHRSQKANRDDARARLKAMVRKALRKPKKRLRTKPTAASKRRRLEGKKRRGEIKRLRRDPEV